MSDENLWGSLDGFRKIRTPTSILREQGQLLNQATKNTLDGVVHVEAGQDRNMTINFYVVAHQLNHYKYMLLQVTHGVKIYPVNVFSTISKHGLKQCADEASFLADVQSILSSSDTRQIIESLLSQCES